MTELQKQVIELVETGKPVSVIAKELGRAISSISSIVKRFNLHPVSLIENPVDDHYFDDIDSDRKAYFLGFFIADGCINKDTKRSCGRFAFNIQADDSYILDILKEELHSHNPIAISNYQIGAKVRKPQARFRWTSVHMRDLFKDKYNITSNKTHDIEFNFPLNSIYNKYLGAFVRGFIDGDGSFEAHEGVFTPRIVGTSKTFLEQIGNLVNNNTGLTYRIYEKQGKTCIYYTLTWSAENYNKPEKIQKLYNFLYDNETVCLKRKKDKIVSYLEYRANQTKIKDIWQCNALGLNLETE